MGARPLGLPPPRPHPPEAPGCAHDPPAAAADLWGVRGRGQLGEQRTQEPRPKGEFLRLERAAGGFGCLRLTNQEHVGWGPLAARCFCI